MTFFAPSSPSFELLLRDSEHRRLSFHEVNVQDALPERAGARRGRVGATGMHGKRLRGDG
ncbi:MAG: hypothetical protein KF718_01105 [Polyangiaceae bacterium]|nr:hypothetical protein [Polyangiaceae bacterium]